MNSTMFPILVATAIILFKCLDTLVVNEMKSADDTKKEAVDGNNNQQTSQQQSGSGNGEMNNKQVGNEKEINTTGNNLLCQEPKLINGLIEPGNIASNMLLSFKKAVGETHLVETVNTRDNVKESDDKRLQNVMVDQQMENKIGQVIDVKDPDISVLKVPLKSRNNDPSKDRNNEPLKDRNNEPLKDRNNDPLKDRNNELQKSKVEAVKDTVDVGKPSELGYSDKKNHRKEVIHKKPQVSNRLKPIRTEDKPRKQLKIRVLSDSRTHQNKVKRAQLHSRRKHNLQVHRLKRRGAKVRNRSGH